MTKKYLVAAGVLCLLLISVIAYFTWWRQAGSIPPLDPKPDETIARKEAFTPFLPSGWQISSVREERLDHIEIPVLHKKLVGKMVRIAEIQGDEVIFRAKTTEHHNRTLNRGRVILTADTGQLVRIELFEAGVVGKLTGQRTLKEADDFFERSGASYEALAPESPSVSFQDILDTIGRKSRGEVDKSRRIEASFLVYGQSGITEPQTVWAVNCYGFPPSSASRGVTWFRHLLSPDGTLLTVSTSP